MAPSRRLGSEPSSRSTGRNAIASIARPETMAEIHAMSPPDLNCASTALMPSPNTSGPTRLRTLGMRKPNRKTASAAAANVQCTSNQAETSSKRATSAPTANAAQPMPVVSIRLSSRWCSRSNVRAAAIIRTAPTSRSRNRPFQKSASRASGANAPMMCTTLNSSTRPARIPCRRGEVERRAASASDATAIARATSSQGRSR